MTAPVLASYASGSGQVSGDNLNTFAQWSVTYAQLKAFTPSPAVANLLVYMQGYSAAGDGGQGFFYWNTTTGTDDSGVTTVVPTGSTAGCWSRILAGVPTRTPQTVDNTSGSLTLTAANMTNEVMVCQSGSTPTNTTPTAAAIIAALAGAQVGSVRPLLVINKNSGTMLIAPGSGVTFTGNLSTSNFSLGTATQKLLYLYYASATAVTVYG